MKIDEEIGYRKNDFRSNFFYGFTFQIALISNENKKMYIYNADVFLNVLVYLLVEKMGYKEYSLFYYIPILFKNKKLTISSDEITCEITINILKKYHTIIDTKKDLQNLYDEIFYTLNYLEDEKNRLSKLVNRDINYREIKLEF